MTRFFRGAAPLALSLIFGLPVVAAATSPAIAAAQASARTQLAAVELSKAGAAAEDSGSSEAKSAADDDAGCYRARKRLWVEGEGWIVRRVTTCR